ncbi:MAG: transglycosylase SLT domain-containing protein [Hyphomicrobiales bacterium]
MTTTLRTTAPSHLPVRRANQPAYRLRFLAMLGISLLLGAGVHDARAQSTVSKAIGLAASGKSTKAQALKSKISDPAARKLIDWLHVAGPRANAGFEKTAAFLVANPHWPARDKVRARAEAGLYKKPPAAERVIRHFAAFPAETGLGKIAHARALRKTGKEAQAVEMARAAWREHNFAASTEKRILTEFKAVLTGGDHRVRMVRLLYERKTSAAERTARRISADHIKMVRAAAALFRRKKGALSAYKRVPAGLRSQVVMQYALARYHRRKGHSAKARAIALAAPGDPARLSHPKPWWIERRTLAREALKEKTAASRKAAYELSKAHGFTKDTMFVQGEFMAGWIALQFLKKPDVAVTHFMHILERDRKPLNVSQANYWLGRAHNALGKGDEAKSFFEAAAKLPTTFYGQLALDALGRGAQPLSIAPTPELSAQAKAEFDARELVKAVGFLGKTNKKYLTAAFFGRLVRDLKTGEERAALATLAMKLGETHQAVRIAKTSARLGTHIDRLAYPTKVLPAAKGAGRKVEMALIYGVTRQESEFNENAISHAGARGLMQIMPGTARILSRKHKVRYRKANLTRKPAYNVRLGSAFLNDLITKFNGSYIMAIAAYNAGPGRIPQWVERLGNPKTGEVEPIDWVEGIPFNETRNYVKRVLENVQVYRTLFGVKPVPITADLSRGGKRQTHASTQMNCTPTASSTIEQLIACN